MDAWIEGTEACVGKLEANPGKSEAVAEHWEVPKEKAAVKPVGTSQKQHRDRHLAAGRRQKPKKMAKAMLGPGRIWPSPAKG
jgi:hypothetical protein